MGLLIPEPKCGLTKRIDEYYYVGMSTMPRDLKKFIEQFLKTEIDIEEIPTPEDVLGLIEKKLRALGYWTEMYRSNVLYLEFERDLSKYDIWIADK